MNGLGSLRVFMDALVGLERTIDPALSVSRWRPTKIDPPAIYNLLNPSPADIPAIGIVHDRLMIGIRIIIAASDLDEMTSTIEGYYDRARDVIDGDLIEPSRSVLAAAAHETRRTTTRSTTDTFNDIAYLGIELVLQADLRRRFV